MGCCWFSREHMKANVIAFQSPIPKVYDMLPPSCAEMNEVLVTFFYLTLLSIHLFSINYLISLLQGYMAVHAPPL